MLKCKHNVDGDGRFKLQIIRTADGSVTHSTSVDYAISAGNADRLDGYNYNNLPYLAPTSSNRPGVTRLYRRDHDSNYNLQHY